MYEVEEQHSINSRDFTERRAVTGAICMKYRDFTERGAVAGAVCMK